MQHPFQCLALAARTNGDILLAAAGSHIYTYRLGDGKQLASWNPSQLERKATPESESTKKPDVRGVQDVKPNEETNGDEEPPNKRRKLSVHGETSDSTSAEIVVEGGSKKRKPSRTSRSAVIKLTTTADARHVVAVTGDDKCIRVFELLGNGTLRQLSER